MDKKILDFPEAAELANDDYIIFDSESGGGCRILAKKIAPVVVGVEATYTQTQEVTEDTPLNDLRQDLVVKAVYRNNRKKVVTDYELSGTLTVGTSTITVTYSGFTTTFNVEVAGINYLYNWDLTQSLTDSVSGRVAITKGATFTSGVGVKILTYTDFLYLGSGLLDVGRTLEIDIAEMNLKSGGTIPFISTYGSQGYRWDSSSSMWKIQKNGSGSAETYNINNASKNEFNNKTLKLSLYENNNMKIWANDVLVYDGGTISFGNDVFLAIGGANSSTSSWGNSCFDMTITGVRIYNT